MFALFRQSVRNEHRIADVYGSRDYAAFSTFIHSRGPSALNAFYSIRYSVQVNTGKDRGIRPGLPLSILQLSRCHLVPDVVCGIDGIDHAAIALQLCQIHGQPIDGIFQDVEHCNRHIGSFAFLKFDFNVEIAVLDGIQDIEARGLAVVDLGAETNMAPTTIHRYLSGGRTPDLPNLMRLADFFDVSLDWLLGISGERYNVMPPEIQDVADLYEVASPEDRRVIQAVLNKYRKEK